MIRWPLRTIDLHSPPDTSSNGANLNSFGKHSAFGAPRASGCQAGQRRLCHTILYPGPPSTNTLNCAYEGV